MADDEDRRLELHFRDPAPVEQTLECVQKGIHERKDHRRHRDVDASGRRRDREAVAGEKSEERRDVHAVPDPADPPRIAVVRRTHSPISQTGRGLWRANAGALSTPPLTYRRCKTPPK